MLIGGDDISNDVTCFSTFVYIRARFRFLFPPLRQNAPESLLAGYQNSNSGNHLQTEWKVKISAQNIKRMYK